MFKRVRTCRGWVGLAALIALRAKERAWAVAQARYYEVKRAYAAASSDVETLAEAMV